MAYNDFGDLDEVGEPGESGTGGGDPGDPYGGDNWADNPDQGQTVLEKNKPRSMQKDYQVSEDSVFSGMGGRITGNLYDLIGDPRETLAKAGGAISALAGGPAGGLTQKHTDKLHNQIAAENRMRAASQKDDSLFETDQQLYDRTTEGSDPQSMKEVAISLDDRTMGINEADIVGTVAGLAIPFPGAGFAVSAALKAAQTKGGPFGGTQYNTGYYSPSFGWMTNPTNQNVAMADFMKDSDYGGEGGSVDPRSLPIRPRPEYGSLNKTFTEPTDNKADLAIEPARGPLRAWRSKGRIYT